jgi:predicted DNA-binding ribbon-helix-helix protein
MPKPRYGRSVPKRGFRRDGYTKSVTVEDAFWAALKEIAAAQGTAINQLISAIDSERREHQYLNLSSAIRLFVVDYYRQQNERGLAP